MSIKDYLLHLKNKRGRKHLRDSAELALLNARIDVQQKIIKSLEFQNHQLMDDNADLRLQLAR